MEKKKILVVEDDKFSFKLYTHLLTEAGYEVASTPRASEAFDLAKQFNPALVIADLMLQDGNGFDVIKKLRQTEQFKNTPIITLSNLGQDADKKEALKVGADKYFVKSNTRFQEIIATIEEMLKAKE
ncbi:MAG: response regulator [Patescibacteria group bacterium]